MARAATTSDAFNAVAEPRRRDILELFGGGRAGRGRAGGEARNGAAVGFETSEGAAAGRVGAGEAAREANVLSNERRRRIRPLHEWTKTFERLWAHQLLRVKERAEQKAKLDIQLRNDGRDPSIAPICARRENRLRSG